MAAMRVALLIAVVVLLSLIAACQLANSRTRTPVVQTLAVASLSESKKPDFNTEIKPIFQARCQPCHFQGGQVYDKMPFDKAETITRLGPKLFTRIKDEKERAVIRQFLDQP
jgi:cytochrome c5